MCQYYQYFRQNNSECETEKVDFLTYLGTFQNDYASAELLTLG